VQALVLVGNEENSMNTAIEATPETQKEEKKHPDIAMSPVESSQLHAIGHDSATNTLAIQFKNKSGPSGVYHYANFTAEKFAEFQAAESAGAHFGKFIKNETEKHPFIKVS